jgi:uncharacterized membrane protein YdjX (TVP38/TMEM64 family)
MPTSNNKKFLEVQEPFYKKVLGRRRLLFFVLLIVVLVAVYVLLLKDWLTFERLNEWKGVVKEFVEGRYLVSVVVFIGLYIVGAGFCLPGLPLLSMLGAFLFGVVEAVIYIVSGATVGAMGAFLMARYFVGHWVQEKFEQRLKTFNKKVEEDGVYYLLTLRLVPLFPFTWINPASGLTKIRWVHFAWTTAIGIIPGTFVIAFTGSQLGAVNQPEDLLSPGLWLALALLGLLALLPLALKKIKK